MSKQEKPAASTPAAEQGQQIAIDMAHANAAYANFCRVTGTPEELIVDFGLNTHPMGPDGPAIDLSQRIVVNFFTAKRMLGALHMAVQRHEAAFGVLETDVQKRVLRPPSASG